jgi:hypothetical protein
MWHFANWIERLEISSGFSSLVCFISQIKADFRWYFKYICTLFYAKNEENIDNKMSLFELTRVKHLCSKSNENALWIEICQNLV